MPINTGSYGREISGSWGETYADFTERLVTFIFKYRPLGILKNLPYSNLSTYLTTRLEMLRANGSVSQNPKPLEPQEYALDIITPPTSETSSVKGDFKVKKIVESGLETDGEDSMREKALLVSFRFHVVNY